MKRFMIFVLLFFLVHPQTVWAMDLSGELYNEFNIGSVLTATPNDVHELLADYDFESLNGIDVILEKVASLSCKAAVKGNHRMSEAEAKQLISDMLTLDNPYHCPHGRPTTISMSKYELERKFKRIV